MKMDIPRRLVPASEPETKREDVLFDDVPFDQDPGPQQPFPPEAIDTKRSYLRRGGVGIAFVGLLALGAYEFNQAREAKAINKQYAQMHNAAIYLARTGIIYEDLSMRDNQVIVTVKGIGPDCKNVGFFFDDTGKEWTLRLPQEDAAGQTRVTEANTNEEIQAAAKDYCT